MILSKKFFPKHQNKVILVLRLLNSRTWLTLKTSLVLFPDLKNLSSLIDLGSLCNLNGLNSPISSKKILILMVWSSMAPKWPILVIFCEMDHQKPNFSLIYGTLSDKGCWDYFIKVTYPKYSKHWPYTVAYTIDCVCSKILNHGLNHGLFLSLFKFISCPIHWIVHSKCLQGFTGTLQGFSAISAGNIL